MSDSELSASTDQLSRIDSAIYFKAARKKPREGERRVTKAHGLQIRIRSRAKNWLGEPIGLLSNNGRPCYEWCEPKYLPKWERHWLTPEELQAHFPPERELGYMQGRGAA
jgi:hypothetical protein